MVELQVGVKAFLKDREGRFLILKLNREKYPERRAKWDIPGGRIKPGKILLKNLQREIKEECGFTIQKEPKLIGAQDILRVKGRHVVRLTYLVGGVRGKVRLSEEHTDFKWVALKELKRIEGLDTYAKELLREGKIE